MVVVNRMSNVVSDVLRNRSEPNQPEPSKLYAQAKEAAKDVKKPAKTPEQQLKECLEKCGPMPRFRKKGDAVNEAKQKEMLRKIDVRKQCRKECCKAPKNLLLAEFVAMTEENKQAHLQALREWVGCEIDKAKSLKEGLAKCDSIKPKFDNRTDGAVPKKRKALLRLKAVWRECRVQCRTWFEVLQKKTAKICGCPPKPPTPPASHLVRRDLREKFVGESREQALCVEKCKQEGKLIRPDQLPKTEAAPKPKPKPVPKEGDANGEEMLNIFRDES